MLRPYAGSRTPPPRSSSGSPQPYRPKDCWLFDARHDDWLVNISDDEQARPVLLAVSDNGVQMTSGRPGGSWPCAQSPSTSAGPAP